LFDADPDPILDVHLQEMVSFAYRTCCLGAYCNVHAQQNAHINGLRAYTVRFLPSLYKKVQTRNQFRAVKNVWTHGTDSFNGTLPTY